MKSIYIPMSQSSIYLIINNNLLNTISIYYNTNINLMIRLMVYCKYHSAHIIIAIMI